MANPGHYWLPLEHPISRHLVLVIGTGTGYWYWLLVALGASYKQTPGAGLPLQCQHSWDWWIGVPRLKWKIIGGQLKTNDRWLHRSCPAYCTVCSTRMWTLSTVFYPNVISHSFVATFNCFLQQVYPLYNFAFPPCTDWCLANYRQILHLPGPQWIRVIGLPCSIKSRILNWTAQIGTIKDRRQIKWVFNET